MCIGDGGGVGVRECACAGLCVCIGDGAGVGVRECECLRGCESAHVFWRGGGIKRLCVRSQHDCNTTMKTDI